MEANVRPERYIPALHFRWLTPLYDPVLRWAYQEGPLKTRLVQLAGLRPGQKALDVGCGTGTLAILLQRAEPRAEVVALDGDPGVLAIARRKAQAAGAGVRWDGGWASALPYPAGSFDVVTTSLMLHHLSRAQRPQALREMERVLRPGGILLAADFGPPRTPLMRALSRVGQLLEDTADGVEGRLPTLLASAGLRSVESLDGFSTPTGTVIIYRAAKPRGESS